MQMKRAVGASLLAVAFAMALPLVLSGAPAEGSAEAPELTPPAVAAAQPSPEPEIPPPEPVLDAATPLRLHTEQGELETTMAAYLPFALAGEMPASFEPEALRAQAVALRSYALYYRAAPKAQHPDADVCTSSACCAAWADEPALRERWGADYDAFWEKICAAVAATDGQYLVWEDAPVLAVFHASSYRRTEDAADLGMTQPYLASVESPETAESVRNLNTTVEVSAGDFRAAVLAAVPDADLSGPDSGWVGALTLNAAGRVSQVVIGGKAVSGLALRQMFSLRSTDFTLAWNDGVFVFRVSGYGHGLGLSQQGANLLAREGCGYADILAHYYPGAELVMAVLEWPDLGS